jgi:hypothetical protein
MWRGPIRCLAFKRALGRADPLSSVFAKKRERVIAKVVGQTFSAVTDASHNHREKTCPLAWP